MNYIQKPKSFPMRALVASVLVAALLLEPSAPLMADLISPAFKIPFNIRTFNIPEALGEVSERHEGTNGKAVVFIQDAHDSLEAQESIAGIIGRVVEEEGVKTVFEEGYEGPVPTDELFQSISDPKVKENVSYFLLDKLRIGGAEYAHINRKMDFKLIGADRIKLHLENVRWFARTARKKQAAAKDLAALTREIKGLANRYFPAELKDWIRQKEKLDQKEIELSDYLLRSRELFISRIGLETFQKSYPHTELLGFARRTGDKDVYEQVREIKPVTLFHEIDRMENDLARLFLSATGETNTRNQKIFTYYKSLLLLTRLLNIEISSEEYEAVKEIVSKLKTEPLARFISEHTGKSIILSKRWERHIQNAVQFYESAHGRDRAIQGSFEQFARTPGEDVAVLVFGGFHKARVKALLRAEGFSYAIVSPKIGEMVPKHRDYYKHLMSGGRHAFEVPLPVRIAARAPSILEMPREAGRVYISTLRTVISRTSDLRNPLAMKQLEESLARTGFGAAGRQKNDERVRFLQTLSQGEDSAVHLVETLQHEKRILKLLSAKAANDAEAIAELRQEVDVLNVLNPDGRRDDIPRVIEGFTRWDLYKKGRGVFYQKDSQGAGNGIVLGYIEGVEASATNEEMDTWRKNQPEMLWRFVVDSARALSYVHANGFVHRDVTPNNFIVRSARDGSRAALADFETASAIGKPVRVNYWKYTPGFSERTYVRGGGWEDTTAVRYDVFSWGATTYFWITGKPPMPSRSNTKRKYDTVYWRRIWENRLRDSPYAPIILKAMNLDRSERYASMEEIIADLEALGRTSGFTTGFGTEEKTQAEKIFEQVVDAAWVGRGDEKTYGVTRLTREHGSDAKRFDKLKLWWRENFIPRMDRLAVPDGRGHLPQDFWEKLTDELSRLMPAFPEAWSFHGTYFWIGQQNDWLGKIHVFDELIKELEGLMRRDERVRVFLDRVDRIHKEKDLMSHDEHIRALLARPGRVKPPRALSIPENPMNLLGRLDPEILASLNRFNDLWTLANFLKSGVKELAIESAASRDVDPQKANTLIFTYPLGNSFSAPIEAGLLKAAQKRAGDGRVLFASPFWSSYELRRANEQDNIKNEKKLYAWRGWSFDQSGVLTLRYFTSPVPVDLTLTLHGTALPIPDSLRAVEFPLFAGPDKRTMSAVVARSGVKHPASFTVDEKTDAGTIRNTVHQFLSDHKPSAVFIKPTLGSSGMGVERMLHPNADDLLRRIHDRVSELTGWYIIEKAVDTYPLLDEGKRLKWNIRTFMFRDGPLRVPRLAGAYARVGADADQYVVNVAQGARVEPFSWVDRHMDGGGLGKEGWANLLREAEASGQKIIAALHDGSVEPVIDEQDHSMSENGLPYGYHVDYFLNEQGELVFNELHVVDQRSFFGDLAFETPNAIEAYTTLLFKYTAALGVFMKDRAAPKLPFMHHGFGAGKGAADEVEAELERRMFEIFEAAGVVHPFEPLIMDTQKGLFLPTPRTHMFRVLDVLAPYFGEPLTVLSAGHGQGEFELMLAHRFPNVRVIGIEFDNRLFKQSQRILHAALQSGFVRADQVRFFHGDFNSQKFTPYFKEADFVYYFNMGTNNVAALAQTLIRNLKPGAGVIRFGVSGELRNELLDEAAGTFTESPIGNPQDLLTLFTRTGFGVEVQVEEESLQEMLQRHENPPEAIDRAMEFFRSNTPNVLEIGSGDTAHIAQMAKNHPEINFIATDIWQFDPEISDTSYHPYWELWRTDNLVAQKLAKTAPNMVVLRAPADELIRHLPDGAIRRLLLVNPEDYVLNAVLDLILHTDRAAVLRPDGAMIVKPFYPMTSEQAAVGFHEGIRKRAAQTEQFLKGAQMKPRSPTLYGVHLASGSRYRHADLDTVSITPPVSSGFGTKEKASNPFPQLGSIDRRTTTELAAYLHGNKYMIRNLFQDGPFSQPSFFTLFAPDPEEVKKITGERARYVLDLPAKWIHPEHFESFSLTAGDIANGKRPLPLVYKPTHDSIGSGIFFLEAADPDYAAGTPPKKIKITMAHVKEAIDSRLSQDYLGKLAEDFRLPPPIYPEGENIAQLFIDTRVHDTPRILSELRSRIATRDSGLTAYDPGMMESMMPLLKMEGKAYETRHRIHVHAATGKAVVSHVGRDDIPFGRTGSSAYFANVTDRREARLYDGDEGIDENHLYVPLEKHFKWNPEERRAFRKYVNGKLRAAGRHVVSQLRAAGFRPKDKDVVWSAVLDLAWLAPEKAGGFPRPMLTEGFVKIDWKRLVSEDSPSENSNTGFGAAVGTLTASRDETVQKLKALEKNMPGMPEAFYLLAYALAADLETQSEAFNPAVFYATAQNAVNEFTSTESLLIWLPSGLQNDNDVQRIVEKYSFGGSHMIENMIPVIARAVLPEDFSSEFIRDWKDVYEAKDFSSAEKFLLWLHEENKKQLAKRSAFVGILIQELKTLRKDRQAVGVNGSRVLNEKALIRAIRKLYELRADFANLQRRTSNGLREPGGRVLITPPPALFSSGFGATSDTNPTPKRSADELVEEIRQIGAFVGSSRAPVLIRLRERAFEAISKPAFLKRMGFLIFYFVFILPPLHIALSRLIGPVSIALVFGVLPVIKLVRQGMFKRKLERTLTDFFSDTLKRLKDYEAEALNLPIEDRYGIFDALVSAYNNISAHVRKDPGFPEAFEDIPDDDGSGYAEWFEGYMYFDTYKTVYPNVWQKMNMYNRLMEEKKRLLFMRDALSSGREYSSADYLRHQIETFDETALRVGEGNYALSILEKLEAFKAEAEQLTREDQYGTFQELRVVALRIQDELAEKKRWSGDEQARFKMFVAALDSALKDLRPHGFGAASKRYDQIVTDPAHHNPDRFTYMVLGVSGLAQMARREWHTASLLHKDDRTGVSLLAPPAMQGFIIRVPNENIRWVSPVTIGREERWAKGTEALIPLIGVRKPSELIELSRRIQHERGTFMPNSMLIRGGVESGVPRFEIVGAYFMDMGPQQALPKLPRFRYDENIREGLMQMANGKKFPVVTIKAPTPKAPTPNDYFDWAEEDNAYNPPRFFSGQEALDFDRAKIGDQKRWRAFQKKLDRRTPERTRTFIRRNFRGGTFRVIKEWKKVNGVFSLQRIIFSSREFMLHIRMKPRRLEFPGHAAEISDMWGHQDTETYITPEEMLGYIDDAASIHFLRGQRPARIQKASGKRFVRHKRSESLHELIEDGIEAFENLILRRDEILGDMHRIIGDATGVPALEEKEYIFLALERMFHAGEFSDPLIQEGRSVLVQLQDAFYKAGFRDSSAEYYAADGKSVNFIPSYSRLLRDYRLLFSAAHKKKSPSWVRLYDPSFLDAEKRIFDYYIFSYLTILAGVIFYTWRKEGGQRIAESRREVRQLEQLLHKLQTGNGHTYPFARHVTSLFVFALSHQITSEWYYVYLETFMRKLGPDYADAFTSRMISAVGAHVRPLFDDMKRPDIRYRMTINAVDFYLLLSMRDDLSRYASLKHGPASDPERKRVVEKLLDGFSAYPEMMLDRKTLENIRPEEEWQLRLTDPEFRQDSESRLDASAEQVLFQKVYPYQFPDVLDEFFRVLNKHRADLLRDFERLDLLPSTSAPFTPLGWQGYFVLPMHRHWVLASLLTPDSPVGRLSFDDLLDRNADTDRQGLRDALHQIEYNFKRLSENGGVNIYGGSDSADRDELFVYSEKNARRAFARTIKAFRAGFGATSEDSRGAMFTFTISPHPDMRELNEISFRGERTLEPVFTKSMEIANSALAMFVSEENPIRIEGVAVDSEMRPSLFFELLSNAIDGIADEAERQNEPYEGRIAIDMYREEDKTVVAFSDNGIGIQPNVLSVLQGVEKVTTKNNLGRKKRLGGVGIGFRRYLPVAAERNGVLEIDTKSAEGEPLKRRIDFSKPEGIRWDEPPVEGTRQTNGTTVRWIIPDATKGPALSDDQKYAGFGATNEEVEILKLPPPDQKLVQWAGKVLFEAIHAFAKTNLSDFTALYSAGDRLRREEDKTSWAEIIGQLEITLKAELKDMGEASTFDQFLNNINEAWLTKRGIFLSIFPAGIIDPDAFKLSKTLAVHRVQEIRWYRLGSLIVPVYFAWPILTSLNADPYLAETNSHRVRINLESVEYFAKEHLKNFELTRNRPDFDLTRLALKKSISRAVLLGLYRRFSENRNYRTLEGLRKLLIESALLEELRHVQDSTVAKNMSIYMKLSVKPESRLFDIQEIFVSSHPDPDKKNQVGDTASDYIRMIFGHAVYEMSGQLTRMALGPDPLDTLRTWIDMLNNHDAQIPHAVEYRWAAMLGTWFVAEALGLLDKEFTPEEFMKGGPSAIGPLVVKIALEPTEKIRLAVKRAYEREFIRRIDEPPFPELKADGTVSSVPGFQYGFGAGEEESEQQPVAHADPRVERALERQIKKIQEMTAHFSSRERMPPEIKRAIRVFLGEDWRDNALLLKLDEALVALWSSDWEKLRADGNFQDKDLWMLQFLFLEIRQLRSLSMLTIAHMEAYDDALERFVEQTSSAVAKEYSSSIEDEVTASGVEDFINELMGDRYLNDPILPRNEVKRLVIDHLLSQKVFDDPVLTRLLRGASRWLGELDSFQVEWQEYRSKNWGTSRLLRKSAHQLVEAGVRRGEIEDVAAFVHERHKEMLEKTTADEDAEKSLSDIKKDLADLTHRIEEINRQIAEASPWVRENQPDTFFDTLSDQQSLMRRRMHLEFLQHEKWQLEFIDSLLSAYPEDAPLSGFGAMSPFDKLGAAKRLELKEKQTLEAFERAVDALTAPEREALALQRGIEESERKRIGKGVRQLIDTYFRYSSDVRDAFLHEMEASHPSLVSRHASLTPEENKELAWITLDTLDRLKELTRYAYYLQEIEKPIDFTTPPEDTMEGGVHRLDVGFDLVEQHIDTLKRQLAAPMDFSTDIQSSSAPLQNTNLDKIAEVLSNIDSRMKQLAGQLDDAKSSAESIIAGIRRAREIPRDSPGEDAGAGFGAAGESSPEIKRMEEKVWRNLLSSGILRKILAKSAHADEREDELMYDHVRFWGEMGMDNSLSIQIHIMHKMAGVQAVTPKLYRISRSTKSQKRLTQRIWEGISEEEILMLAHAIAKEFHDRDLKGWLTVEQSAAIDRFYPALQDGKVKVESDVTHAQFIISVLRGFGTEKTVDREPWIVHREKARPNDLRVPKPVDVSMLDRLKTDVIFSIEAKTIHSLTAEQWTELISLKMLNEKKLHLLIRYDTTDELADKRIRELRSEFKNVYVGPWSAQLDQKSLKGAHVYHFSDPNESEPPRGRLDPRLTRRIEWRYFGLLFGVALLHEYYDAYERPLPGLESVHGFVQDPRGFYAAEVLEQLFHNYAAVAVAA